MKNIRLYEAPKYATEEYKKVKEGIYKITYIPENNDGSFGLNGIVDEELVARLSSLEGWEDNQKEGHERFQSLIVDGIEYHRDKQNPDDENQKIWYYEPVKNKPVTAYVTSIMYEPEPEYGENEPDNPLVSQYPLEDILDKYFCYCFDEYTKENEEDPHHSYIEFASDRRKDIVSLLEIVGKHVYNQEDGDYVKLIIE